MKRHHQSFISGILLILLGIVLLANNLGWMALRWDTLWPWLVILVGAWFWLRWILDRKNVDVVIPGTIFLTYGLMFLYCTHTDWENMAVLWPLFIIGPGLGLFANYFLGTRESGTLTAAIIVTGIGLIFLVQAFRFHLFWPLLLILLGTYLLLKSTGKLGDGKQIAETADNEVKDSDAPKNAS